MPVRTQVPKPATPASRVGRCGARARGGTCPCDGLTSPTFVGGYRTCCCGHTQQVHALVEAAPAAA